jgi:hypothetical protein
MGKWRLRDPLPGETFFGGGSGILVPFRPMPTDSSGRKSDTPPTASTEEDRLPDPGTRAYAELHGLPYDPEADPEEILRLLLAGEPLPARSRQLLGLEETEPTDPGSDQAPEEP